MFSSPGAENSSSQMNIRTGNVYDTLSEESDAKDSVASLTHEHGQSSIAVMPPPSLPAPVTTEEQELDAEYMALQERIQSAALTARRQRNAAMKVQVEAAERQHAITSSLSASAAFMHPAPGTPATVIHQPVNRHLFPTNVKHMTGNQTPMSAIALAKKQSYIGLAPVVPAIDMPDPVPVPSSSSASNYHRKYNPPVKFTGDKDTQNAAVEQWIIEVNKYMKLTHVPLNEQLEEATFLLSGYALKWYTEKEEELQHEGLVMTWGWLQGQLIENFGRSTGQVAERAQWAVLVMGIKNTDGTHTGGKATYTVKSYTDLFTRFMKSLTSHTLLTHDIVVIDRYTRGIQVGYPALWSEMKAQSKQSIDPQYDTLTEAITAAELAESALSVSKIQQSSVSSSHHRAHQTRVNNMESTTDDSPPHSPVNRRRQKKPSTLTANGFVYRPVSSDEGRYQLSESEQKSLYDHNRCYHCYQPRHPKMNSCPKKMTVPPSLN
jgi:hypothetical protein